MTTAAQSDLQGPSRSSMPSMRRRGIKMMKLSPLAVSYLLLIPVCLLSLTTGAADISLLDGIESLYRLLSGETTDSLATSIVWNIRLPRLFLGLFVGAILGSSGAITQGVFRNPLASPGLIGIQSGASLGAAMAIIMGVSMPIGLLAFLAGAAVSGLIYFLGRSDGKTNVTLLLLSGVAVNAVVGALLGLMVFTSDESQLRDFTFWTLGSLGGAHWEDIVMAAPIWVLCLIASPRLGRSLNIIALGENHARYLGVPVERIKAIGLGIVALGVGSSIAFTGMIGFIGLVAPHIARLWLKGGDSTDIIKASRIIGALIVVLADTLCRSLIPPAELPIGTVTACLGGPFFVWLLLKERKKWQA